MQRQLQEQPKTDVPRHESGNSQLLNDYKETLEKAYHLGEDIRTIYNIVPPKVYVGVEAGKPGSQFLENLGPVVMVNLVVN